MVSLQGLTVQHACTKSEALDSPLQPLGSTHMCHGQTVGYLQYTLWLTVQLSTPISAGPSCDETWEMCQTETLVLDLGHSAQQSLH